MLAIVNISGKQFNISSGNKIKVPLQDTEVGKNIVFNSVLLTDNGKEVNIGKPFLKDVSVSTKVLEHGRDRKILIYKKKRRKGYQRKNGFRARYTLLEVGEITLKKSPAKKKKAAPKSSTADNKKTKEV
ncbi:MAG: 50S ribosomal protein L21 [Candidatus Neomarinimicrobiota bacterium]